MNVNWFTGDYFHKYLTALSKKYKFSLDTPIGELPKDIYDMILYGNNGEELKVQYATNNFSGEFKGTFEGIINNLYRRYRETTSDFIKAEIERFMVARPCPTCRGKRLNKEALSVKIAGKNIAEVCDLSVAQIIEWLNTLKLTKKQEKISADILKEIRARCSFLIEVGLDYLTLSRSSGTLSGGEAQRIRLATQIGSG